MSKARNLANLLADGSIGADELNVGQFGNRNLIINGAMQIDSRNSKALHSLLNGFAGYDLFDRYFRTNNGSSVTLEGSTDAPAGFINSMLMTFSNNSGHFSFGQKIEGVNASVLKLGLSDAKEFTFSFYAKCSTVGTYSLAFSQDFLGANNYVTTFDITSANTWERIIVTIPPITSGPWNKTNGPGLTFMITLVDGAFLTTTSLNTWNNDSNFCWSGQTTIASNGTFQITGVQLEVGDTATPFEHRSYGQELALCQRYFQNNIFAYEGLENDTEVSGVCYYKQTMRAAPTLTAVNEGGASASLSGLLDRSAAQCQWWLNIGATTTYTEKYITADAEL